MVYSLQVMLFRPRRSCTQEKTARTCRWSRVCISPVQAVWTIDVPHWMFFLLHWMFHYNKYHCFHVLFEKWFTSNFRFSKNLFKFCKISPFQSVFSIKHTIVTYIVHNSLFHKIHHSLWGAFLHLCGLICHHLQHQIKSGVRFKILSTLILGFYRLMRTNLL